MSALFPRALDGEAPALALDEDALSHEELGRAVTAHLARLREAGARPGDRVAVFTDPSLATMVALAAHAAGGYVSVPLNPKLGPRELGHILGDAEPRLVVGENANERAPRRPSLEPAVDTSGEARVDALEVDDSPMLILYTSGTTGAPKGAVLTRRNVAFDLDGLADAWAWTADDTVVHALPLFHVHGLVLGLFGSLRVGGSLRWRARFDPDSLAATLARGRTMLFSVPTMIHRLADAAERSADIARDLSAARLLISGSAGLPVREHRRIEALTGRGVLERYGLTETLINCAVRGEVGPRPGYVGPPLRGIELRLVDESRQPLDAHDDTTLAEVAVRGPNVFAGYLNRPEVTAEVRDEVGFFYTGDLATRTSDGAIRIVGRRATDLIKTGGFKVGAGEIEAALLEHASVAEAAVVGRPDDDLGERIVAYVVTRAGEAPAPEGLIEWVAGQLSPHKRPREVHFVDALPRNAMGKVQKGALEASSRSAS